MKVKGEIVGNDNVKGRQFPHDTNGGKDIFGMGGRERNKRRLSEKNKNRIEGNVAKRFMRVYGFKKRVRI